MATAGLLISRATAYRIWLRACCEGKSAFEDQRHGHPAKVRGPVPEWNIAHCQAHPHTPSHALQRAIQERFEIAISVRHLNRVRAALGVRFERPTVAQKSSRGSGHARSVAGWGRQLALAGRRARKKPACLPL